MPTERSVLEELAGEFERKASSYDEARRVRGLDLVARHRHEATQTAYSLAAAEVRNRLASLPPEPQGGWPDCEMAMVGERLVRVRPGADSHGYPTRRYVPASEPTVLSEEDRERLRQIADTLGCLHAANTDADAAFLRKLADQGEGR